jgi:hypothetical protein
VTVENFAIWSLLLGATSAGVTTAVRALPVVYSWMLERKKPWACDICMSFWTVALITLGLALWQRDETLLVTAGPAYPWALWVLRKTSEPHGPPPMPPLEDGE